MDPVANPMLPLPQYLQISQQETLPFVSTPNPETKSKQDVSLFSCFHEIDFTLQERETVHSWLWVNTAEISPNQLDRVGIQHLRVAV